MFFDPFPAEAIAIAKEHVRSLLSENVEVLMLSSPAVPRRLRPILRDYGDLRHLRRGSLVAALPGGEPLAVRAVLSRYNAKGERHAHSQIRQSPRGSVH